MIELEDDAYYWVEDEKTKEVYIGRYNADWGLGVFDLNGSDEIYHKEEFNVLGKIDIPDYINKEKLR